MLNRASYCSSKLILLVNSSTNIKIVAGVQGGIPQKVEYIAVKLVGPRLGNHADHTATVIAILCIKIARQHPEFRDRVQIGNHRRSIVQRVVYIATVDLKSVRRLAPPVDRDIPLFGTSKEIPY